MPPHLQEKMNKYIASIMWLVLDLTQVNDKALNVSTKWKHWLELEAFIRVELCSKRTSLYGVSLDRIATCVHSCFMKGHIQRRLKSRVSQRGNNN